MRMDRGRAIPGLPVIAVLALVAFLSNGCATMQGHGEYQTAVSLFKAGKYSEAREHALTAYNSNSGDPAYIALLGWTYFKQGDFEEAGRLFSLAEGKGPNSIAPVQGLAWLSYVLDDYDNAEKRFRNQLVWAERFLFSAEFPYFSGADQGYINSVASDAYYGLGLIATARGKGDEARRLLSKSLELTNDFMGHGPVGSAIGDLYYQNKDYRNAATWYEKSVKEKPDDEVRARLAWSLYSSGDFAGAAGLFAKIALEAGDKRSPLYGLALCQIAMKQIDKAGQSLKALIRIDGYYADIPEVSTLIAKNEPLRVLWKNFGVFYFDRGDFRRASDKLRLYLTVVRSDCEARVMEAWCTFYIGDRPLALRKFTKLRDERQCEPDQAETGRGVVLLYLERLEEADKALEEACRLNKDNLRAVLARGAVAFARGDYQGAIRIYEANLSSLSGKELHFSWPSHAVNNLGWCYVRTGRYRDALAAFQRLKALQQNPTSPHIFDGLGWTYALLGQAEEARSSFQTALRLDPTYISSRMGLLSIGGKRGK